MTDTAPGAPLVLYRFGLSGHSHRVELFLHLLGLPATFVDVDLLKGEQRQAAFAGLNRFLQVPVLADGGVVIADSNAILVYLARRYGAEHWFPADALRAARVQQWLSQAAGALARGPATARAIEVFALARDAAPAVAEAHWLFTRLDASLADEGGPWLVPGEQPTIADVALYTYTAHAPEGGVSLASYPALRAWLQRVERLPGFAPMASSPVGLNRPAPT